MSSAQGHAHIGGTSGMLPQVGDSPIARYHRIASLIRARIMSGAYQPGARIGTEHELAETFGVSRITVRQALGVLEKENLIVRLRARGTFVADDVRPRAVVELTGYLDDLFLQAYAARTVVQGYQQERASADVAAHLRISPGDPVWRLRRVRIDEDLPKARLINFIPHDIGARYTPELLERSSFLQLIDTEPDTRPAWGHERITADSADAETARALDVEPGDPVLLVERVLYTESDRPLELLRQYYRSDRFRFRVHLHRPGSD